MFGHVDNTPLHPAYRIWNADGMLSMPRALDTYKHGKVSMKNENQFCRLEFGGGHDCDEDGGSKSGDESDEYGD